MNRLPSDVIDIIISYLDNKSYLKCLLSATLFHTYRLNNINFERYFYRRFGPHSIEFSHKKNDLCLSILELELCRWDRLDILQFLIYKKVICQSCLIGEAAGCGYLKILKFFYKDGFNPYVNHLEKCEICDVKAIDRAACLGELETVKWLHEERSEIFEDHDLGVEEYTYMSLIKERNYTEVLNYISQICENI